MTGGKVPKDSRSQENSGQSQRNSNQVGGYSSDMTWDFDLRRQRTD